MSVIYVGVSPRRSSQARVCIKSRSQNCQKNWHICIIWISSKLGIHLKKTMAFLVTTTTPLKTSLQVYVPFLSTYLFCTFLGFCSLRFLIVYNDDTLKVKYFVWTIFELNWNSYPPILTFLHLSSCIITFCALVTNHFYRLVGETYYHFPCGWYHFWSLLGFG